jgi:alkylated DNA repair dioxygenase AlkB
VPPPSESPLPEEDSTDVKLAQLVSLFPDIPQETLLDVLVSCSGSVEATASTITTTQAPPTKKRAAAPGTPAVQTSLSSHVLKPDAGKEPSTSKKRSLTKKGQTLQLFSPEDVAAHTPCTIIHNYLPPDQANALLLELLDESKYFSRYKFQLFDRTVESPHSTSVYVSTAEEYRQHTSEYTYGGTYRSNVRQITPHMRAVSGKVQRTVNDEVRHRIKNFYPGGKKLKYQSPKEWMPNAAFVNCYDGPGESVGYHSDELTYLGPRPIIGSLSLGVEREFRVRRIVPSDDEEEILQSEKDVPSHQVERKQSRTASDTPADTQGQISIHLPHNSLLIMHAEMQEEWKHAIAPAQTVSPHPLSGNRRINITYRWYRDSLHPRNTPRCRCGMHAILRCAQRKRETRGRYMWMCYAGFAPGKKSCGFFQWAELDDDGEPIWSKGQTGDNAPILRNFVDE